MLIAFLIVFGLLQLLVIPIIIKYSRRGVTKWHRPKMGEVAVIAIVLTMVAAALAAILVKSFSLERLLDDRRSTTTQQQSPDDENEEPVIPLDSDFLPMEEDRSEPKDESPEMDPPIPPVPTVETTTEPVVETTPES